MGCEQSRDNESLERNSSAKKANDQQNKSRLFELENIRNTEDLSKLIVKRLIQKNELVMSTQWRKKSQNLQDQGNYEDALKIEKRVLKVHRDAVQDQKVQQEKEILEFSKSLIKVGDLMCTLQQSEESFVYFREVLDLEGFESLESQHQRALKEINKISSILLQNGKLESALLFKKEVLNYSIYFFGQDNENQEKNNLLRSEIKQFEEILQKILILQSNRQLIDVSFFDEDQECMICCKTLTYDRQKYQTNADLEKINITRLRCNHIFHSNCLNQWFLKKQNCPYCRSDLHDEDQVSEFNMGGSNGNGRGIQIEDEYVMEEQIQAVNMLSNESNNSE